MILQNNLNALEFTNKPLKEKILSLKKEEFIDIFPSQTPFVPSKQDLSMPNIFFCGIGEGLFLKKLINKHIFIFDKAEFFANVLSKIDLNIELSSGKIYLCDVEEKRLEEQLCLLFSQKDCFEYLGLFKLLSYSEFYDQSAMFDFVYDMCLSVIKRVVGNVDTSFTMDAKIYKQFLANIPSILENIPFQRFIYENKAKNKSVIVVCAGPSLNKQLELLKAYQDDYVIFSLDATYKTLLKNEIYPDFVFSMDIYEECASFYENLPSNKKEPIYIVSSAVDKSLMKILDKKENKIFILKNLDYQQKFNLNEFGYLDIGINVAHFAYSFAIALGFVNVIIIGQDLAFNEKGNSHADASAFTFYDVEAAEHKATKLEVLAYGKLGLVQTHIGWNEFRKRLEVLFLSHPSVNFYNATEGGAFIDYTKEISFKEILEKLKDKKQDFILPNALSVNRQKKYLNKVLELLQKDFLELQNLNNDATKLLNVLQNCKETNVCLVFETILDLILKFNIILDEAKILQSFMYKPLFYHRGFFNASLYQDPQNALYKYIDFLKIFKEFSSLSLEAMMQAEQQYKNFLKI
ncbi:motility associated factor glycosyltransferase family protein [Campylobacter volucris]|uniref:motility associated factor glycosyltransferase family protein n=1 Tax=Campylobacter volucris TaxID=1031542 RepID=UPI00189F2F1D|nr:6-hydroxymethylpterin diphosphokinase MptE-like protein [Campylobacter volucris]MBF7048912.1 motility associated factor glycosyltransferase family protein [Campylobacter volucris]MBF7059567.1 motility associated factor glycosyltransferase family protein [Campylobacter volucris]